MTGMVPNKERGVCIVCGRNIPKRTVTTFVKPSTARFSGGPWATIEADLRTRAECQAYTNMQIISHQKNLDGLIVSFSAWDGQTFVNEYFCRDKCAMAQGQASARHGERYIWKRADD